MEMKEEMNRDFFEHIDDVFSIPGKKYLKCTQWEFAQR